MRSQDRPRKFGSAHEIETRLCSDVARLLAVVALMTDDVGKIADARAFARRAYRTIEQNLFVGVRAVHVLGIIAGLLKRVGPVQAAIIPLGPDVLVFHNSVRVLRMRLAPDA